MESEHRAPSPAPPPFRRVRRVLEELGLATLYRSPLDVKLLCAQRMVRLFAYGGSTLILVSYFKILGFSEERVGLFMTLTLVGDVCISFLLTAIADSLGRKAILSIGSIMMTISGIVFAMSGNYWILLLAAVFGVISPSGNEIGPFRAVEESTIAWLTPSHERSDLFAWYTLLGTAGTALGAISCGWLVRALMELGGWDRLQAYRGIFILYAAAGVIKLSLSILLSRKCEVNRPAKAEQAERAPLLPNASPDGVEPAETAPLISGTDVQPPKSQAKISFLPQISRKNIPTTVKLCILFGMDSFASSLVASSWIAYFFQSKFGITEGKLGSIFFTTAFIAAGSILLSSSIAKRLGNVKTMAFTHMPSNIFLALIGVPDSATAALVMLILRSCTQSMDTAPRAAFTVAILDPKERTAIMGIFNIMKTFTGSMGPIITGVLAERGLFWVVFILGGAIKTTYDLGILAMFRQFDKKPDNSADAEADQPTDRPR